LSQVASKTPHYPHTPGYGGQSSYVNTPYTPSGQTPFMTPYHTPHHSTQTPRYGQTTPNNHSNGPFAHPRPPAHPRSRPHSSNAYNKPSPRSYRSPHVPSPRSRPTPTPGPPSRPTPTKNVDSEELEWEQASEAWEAQQTTPKTNSQGNHGSSTVPTPSYSTADPEELEWEQASEAWEAQVSTPQTTNNTPRFDDKSQKTPQYIDPYSVGKSPRSVRSTPRTNTSPHSMTLGDATPLYDEN